MGGIRFSPRPNRAHEITWQEWDLPAFEKARAENRPILLSISAVWCHWCHVMDETSYSDPQVIGLINERFVPVRVDNDHRPDVNSRYNMGGWPTTAFLTPEGDVIAGGTYMAPDELKAALVRVSEAYRDRKDAVIEAAAERRTRRQHELPLPSGETVVADSIVNDVLRALEGVYEPQHGGFGSQPKFPMAAAVELLLHAYRTTGDTRYRRMVEKTMDEMMGGGLCDHQEGGVRYSTTMDWSEVHYEKMLEGNVGLLSLYLRGYLVLGNLEYAGVASRVVDYMMGHLYDDVSGAFYGSQDADEGYYVLPLAQRRMRAAPVVDRVFYTDLNAAVVSAFLEASWAINRPELADVSRRVLEFLLGRWREGPLRHSYTPEGEEGIPALLADYAHLVMAVLDAYGNTRQPRYLDLAQELAGEMRALFWDHEGGGFFDVRDDPGALGMIKLRGKPIVDNVPAAEALTKLARATHTQGYLADAETVLGVFVPVYQEQGEGAAGYALAVQRFLYPPVEMSVVGRRGAADTMSLLSAAATVASPHRAITFIDADDEELLAELGYWAGEAALAYVCVGTTCLPPIGDPMSLGEALEELLKDLSQGSEDIIKVIGDLG